MFTLNPIARGVLAASSNAIPEPADPYIGSVTSLLHFDGEDGSTTMTDDAGLFTWTANGNAQIDQGRLLLDGSGDYLVSSGSSEFDFGSEDFTVEMYINLSSLPAESTYFRIFDTRYQNTNTDNSFALLVNGSGKLVISVGSANHTSGPGSGVMTVGKEQHIALVRTGDTLLSFIEGGLHGQVPLSESKLFTAGIGGSAAYIGVSGYNAANSFTHGYIDEFRVTKGVARYTEDFTPPERPLPNP